MQQEHHEQPTTLTQAILHDYKAGIGTFSEKNPKLANSYKDFTEACFEAGSLDQKQKQLIALGISICSQDEYCIVYHTKGCLDQGCTEEEILESIAVAAAFGGGAAMSQGVTLVQEAISEITPVKH
ncbi:carboxymuconolactone decarboxylase family protein [Tuberibacillus sp. Marseille-P3662]|uniref:carboxymuconolactone decarboxylase family protein n=1 Tax=Tuberibacillus sp. Marseille-P3662 TaxID=1965358 RepID=UPI000A1CA789|nr:carboxymuconolactone decarboxylase family protein [Tuberibacillus sp. Marseille-P3662]